MTHDQNISKQIKKTKKNNLTRDLLKQRNLKHLPIQFCFCGKTIYGGESTPSFLNFLSKLKSLAILLNKSQLFSKLIQLNNYQVKINDSHSRPKLILLEILDFSITPHVCKA